MDQGTATDKSNPVEAASREMLWEMHEVGAEHPTAGLVEVDCALGGVDITATWVCEPPDPKRPFPEPHGRSLDIITDRECCALTAACADMLGTVAHPVHRVEERWPIGPEFLLDVALARASQVIAHMKGGDAGEIGAR